MIRSKDDVNVRTLVVYPVLKRSALASGSGNATGEPGALELRLAWEMDIKDKASTHVLYFDAVTGEVISAPPENL